MYLPRKEFYCFIIFYAFVISIDSLSTAPEVFQATLSPVENCVPVPASTVQVLPEILLA
jgi:hypothetical protein